MIAEHKHLRIGTRFSTIKHMVGGHLFSQTGAELFGWDKFSDEDPRCLLEVMTDPSALFMLYTCFKSLINYMDTDRPFMNALQKFKKIQIVANG
jgi:hypothetical protein